MTKKEISEQTRTTRVDSNTWHHMLFTDHDNYSVRTYGFGKRPPAQVETSIGFCIGEAKTRKEFISVVYNHIKTLKR